jgi:hypothetical protein
VLAGEGGACYGRIYFPDSRIAGVRDFLSRFERGKRNVRGMRFVLALNTARREARVARFVFMLNTVRSIG